MARKQSRTNRQIVEDCNSLARLFYSAHGYQVPEGYRFDRASHPQELGMWNLAVLAFDYLQDTDVEDALMQLEDNEP